MLRSIKLNAIQVKRLKNYLKQKQIHINIGKSENEDLRVDNGDLFIILYKSGSLVYKENEITSEILDHILKIEDEFDYIFGSDEVGKGEWYGPLVVTCVGATPAQIKNLQRIGVKDSKRLKPNKIEEIYHKILKEGVIIETIILPPYKFNSLWIDFKNEGKNYNDLIAWAHSKAIKMAIEKLNEVNKIKVVIDKFDQNKMDLRLQTINRSKVEIVQKSSGESEIPVAAASIISKKKFEDYLRKLQDEYEISDLKRIQPESLDPRTLFYVAKIHFNNIDDILKSHDKNYEINIKSQEEKLKKIIQKGENEQVEFKSLLPKEERNIGKKFIGMINSTLYYNLESREVYLFIGINDDGTPCGIEPVINDAIKRKIIKRNDKKSLQQYIINKIKDHSDPKIIPNSDFFDYDDHEILFFSYNISDKKLINYDGIYYIRSGDIIDKMTSEMIENYFKRVLIKQNEEKILKK
ncbi:MAG: RNA-binding domain-containing protein [Candidatus Helarchaeota archaeon]